MQLAEVGSGLVSVCKCKEQSWVVDQRMQVLPDSRGGQCGCDCKEQRGTVAV